MLTIQFIFWKRKHHRAFPNGLTAMMFWKWCSRRESNPKCKLRRFELYPFNYENVFFNFFEILYRFLYRFRNDIQKQGRFKLFSIKNSPFYWLDQPLRRGLLYPFNYGSKMYKIYFIFIPKIIPKTFYLSKSGYFHTFLP